MPDITPQPFLTKLDPDVKKRFQQDEARQAAVLARIRPATTQATSILGPDIYTPRPSTFGGLTAARPGELNDPDTTTRARINQDTEKAALLLRGAGVGAFKQALHWRGNADEAFKLTLGFVPDKEAKIQIYARELPPELGEDFVRANFEEVERDYLYRDFRELMKDSDALAQWASDPSNMVLAYDNGRQLASLRDLLVSRYGGTDEHIGVGLRNVSASFKQGALGSYRLGAEAVDWASLQFMQSFGVEFTSEELQQIEKRLAYTRDLKIQATFGDRQAAKELEAVQSLPLAEFSRRVAGVQTPSSAEFRRTKETQRSLSDEVDGIYRFAVDLPGSMSELALNAAMFFVNPALPLASIFARETGGTYGNLRDQGVSQGTASAVAIPVGIINTLLEKAQLSTVTKRFGIGKRLTKETTRAFIGGLLADAGNNLWQETVQNMVTTTGELIGEAEIRDRSAAEILSELQTSFKEGAYEGLLVATSSAIFGIGSVGPGLRRVAINDLQRKKLGAVSKIVDKMSLLTRSPEKLREAVDAVLGADAGNTANIDAETFNQLVPEGLREEALGVLGIDAETYSQAIATNDVLRFSLGSWAAVSSTRVGTDLFDHVRFGPNGLTTAESLQLKDFVLDVATDNALVHQAITTGHPEGMTSAQKMGFRKQLESNGVPKTRARDYVELLDQVLKRGAQIKKGTTAERLAERVTLEVDADPARLVEGERLEQTGSSVISERRLNKHGSPVYQVQVEGKNVGHLAGEEVSEFLGDEIRKDLGLGEGSFFKLQNTQLNEANRGKGLYQQALQDVAAQYDQGLVIQKYEASGLLQRAARKVEGFKETKDNIFIPAPRVAAQAASDVHQDVISRIGPGAQTGVVRDEASGDVAFNVEDAVRGLTEEDTGADEVFYQGITTAHRGKFLRGVEAKTQVSAVDVVATVLTDDVILEYDDATTVEGARQRANGYEYLEPKVRDHKKNLRYNTPTPEGYYGNKKMAFPNDAYPQGRKSWDVPGCGRKAWALKNDQSLSKACYGGSCYAESIKIGKQGKNAGITAGINKVGVRGAERTAVLESYEKNGLAVTETLFPMYEILERFKGGEFEKLTVGKFVDAAGDAVSPKEALGGEFAVAAIVSTDLQNAKGADIRLGVDTDGAAWLAKPEVMDAIHEADPRTVTVYSSGYHTPPQAHALSGRTMINVTVSGWHPLVETMSRLRWAEEARANGWNVILREVVADPAVFGEETAKVYNRLHEALLQTDFFLMQQPLHVGKKHGAPMWGLPACCKGSKQNPHTCDQCEVSEGLGRRFANYWEIAETDAKEEQIFPDLGPRTYFQETSQLDADYNAAVERGDEETAQRLVDETADAAGFKVEAFHGTTHGKLRNFNLERSNPENFLGRVHYFTSSEYDAEANYAGEGPDLTQRIALRSDQIVDDFDYIDAGELETLTELTEKEMREKDWLDEEGSVNDTDARDVADYIARLELAGDKERTLAVRLKLDNPVEFTAVRGRTGLAGREEVKYRGNQVVEVFDTDFTKEQLDEAWEEVKGEEELEDHEREDYEGEILNRATELANVESKIVVALRKALEERSTVDTEEINTIIAEVQEQLGYENEVTTAELMTALRYPESLLLVEDEDGKIASSDVTAQVFKNLGFDGVIVHDVKKIFPNMGISDDTTHYHVFDENKTQIKSADAITRDQSGDVISLSERFDLTTADIYRQQKRGAVTFRGQEINVQLFRGNWDKSTPVHEFGHVALKFMQEAFAEGNTDPEFLKNYEAVRAFTNDFSVEGIEKLIDQWEGYFMEGKAPSVEIAGAFARFKNWLIDLYGTVVDRIGQEEIAPEIRQVFGSWIASAEEAEEAAAYYHTYESAADIVLKKKDAQTEKARTKIETEKEKHIREAVNERIKVWRQETGGSKGILAQATAEVDAEPIYKAIAQIESEGGIPPQDLATYFTGSDIGQIVAELRAKHGQGIVAKATKDVDLEAFLDWVTGADQLDSVAAKHKFDDVRALVLEIKETAPRVDAIQDRANAIEARHAQSIKVDVESEAGSTHNEATLDLIQRDIARLEALERGRSSAALRRAKAKAIRDQVRDELRSTLDVRDASQYQRWAAQEAVYVRKALAAARRGDGKATLENRRKQWKYHATIVEAVKLRDDFDKIQRSLMGKPLNSKLKNVEPRYANVVRELVFAYRANDTTLPERTGVSIKEVELESQTPGEPPVKAFRLTTKDEVLGEFPTRGAALRAWRQYVRTQPLDLPGLGLKDTDSELKGMLLDLQEVIPPWVQLKETPDDYVNLKDLTFNQVEEINAAIQRLIQEGGLYLTALKELGVQTVNEIVDGMVGTMASLPKRDVQDPGTVLGKAQDRGSDLAAWAQRPEFLLDQVDGFATLTGENTGFGGRIFDRASLADAEYDVRMREIMEGDAAKGIPGLQQALTRLARASAQVHAERGSFFSVEGAPVPAILRERRGWKGWTFERILPVVLNMGNDANRGPLQKSAYQFTDEQLDALASVLPADALRAVQDIWDSIDVYDDLARVTYAVNFKSPPKEEATPFVAISAEGEAVSMEGGYYPLAYDSVIDPKAAKDNEKSNITASLFNQATRLSTQPASGTAKARVRDVETGESLATRPPDLSLGVLVSKLSQTLRLVTHSELLYDLHRITNSRDFYDAFVEKFSQHQYNALRKWINRMARPERKIDGSANRMIEALRGMHTVSALGLRTLTAGKQALSAFNAVSAMNDSAQNRSGIGALIRGASEFARSPKKTFEFINSVDKFMKARSRSISREFRDFTRNVDWAKNDFLSKIKRTRKWAAEVAFVGIRAVDTLTTYSVWMGAYKQALEQKLGDVAGAKTEAEAHEAAVVYARRIVRTTQPSGMPSDQSQLQAQEGTIRLFTQFMSFKNIDINRAMHRVAAARKGKIGATSLISYFVTERIAPAWAMLLPAFIFYNEDDQPEWWELLVQPGLDLTGGMPFVNLVEREIRWGRPSTYNILQGFGRGAVSGKKVLEGKYGEGAYEAWRTLEWFSGFPVTNPISDAKRLYKKIKEK